ncbi:MAG: hypothetical protein ACPGTS_02460 [Minisyncoccia bacterium]
MIKKIILIILVISFQVSTASACMLSVDKNYAPKIAYVSPVLVNSGFQPSTVPAKGYYIKLFEKKSDFLSCNTGFSIHVNLISLFILVLIISIYKYRKRKKTLK